MLLLAIAALLLVSTTDILPSGDLTYPEVDFYNRNLELPIDHTNPEKGTFTLYYELSSNFDFARPTLFFFQDSQQGYGSPGKVDDLARRYHFYEPFNVVRYQHRGRKYSYIELLNDDGTYNWEKAYRFLSSKQVVEDIERIRLDLFSEKPDTKIYAYGRSGGGYLIQEYLAKYSKHVKRAFIRAAPNPLIMEKLGFLESRSLVNALDAIDPALHGRLKQVLDRDMVPRTELLWLLFRIPMKYDNSEEIMAGIVNQLHEGSTESYERYVNEKGLSFARDFGSKDKLVEKEMGIGSYLRPIECDGKYLLGPPPDHVDPLYYCLRELSSPYIELVESKKVPPPAYVSFEGLKGIESEVFYLAGSSDHVSPYQIGIELGKHIDMYELFIADDTHTLLRHTECYPQLRNAFFKFGIGSEELAEARRFASCQEWKPE